MKNKSMAANLVNMIVLAPPLIISTVEIDEGVAIMEIALEAADVHTE
jgi:4-aminobutyrate aminotransferase-like enzyme